MTQWIIDILRAADVVCNLIFYFWFLFYVVYAFRHEAFPVLAWYWNLIFGIALLGMVFIPSKSTLYLLFK